MNEVYCTNYFRHNLEALDVAQTKMTANLASHINTLEAKKIKLREFMENVNQQKDKITQASAEIQKEAKAQIDELRAILDEKEKEMQDDIKRMENNKQATINSEITKAQQVS